MQSRKQKCTQTYIEERETPKERTVQPAEVAQLQSLCNQWTKSWTTITWA